MQINLFAEETQLQRLSELGDSLEKLNVIDFESFRPLLEKVNCKGNHTIFRLDTHLNLTYLCAVTFNNNDYGKRKSKLPGGI